MRLGAEPPPNKSFPRVVDPYEIFVLHAWTLPRRRVNSSQAGEKKKNPRLPTDSAELVLIGFLIVK